MKKHLSIYVFIAILVMGFTGNVVAYPQCGPNQDVGTCHHQNGKGKNNCENLYQEEKEIRGDCTYHLHQHCKWWPVSNTCEPSGGLCKVSIKC
jgi:hypothetical protein